MSVILLLFITVMTLSPSCRNRRQLCNASMHTSYLIPGATCDPRPATRKAPSSA